MSGEKNPGSHAPPHGPVRGFLRLLVELNSSRFAPHRIKSALLLLALLAGLRRARLRPAGLALALFLKSGCALGHPDERAAIAVGRGLMFRRCASKRKQRVAGRLRV